MANAKTFDLERLKWIKPRDPKRFQRVIPVCLEDVSDEALLDNIVRLTDEIFNDLAIFGQFSEVGSRGATVDPAKKISDDMVSHHLRAVQNELWLCHTRLKQKRYEFLDHQLDSLGLTGAERGLKLHIGAGGHILAGWLNIDAGGSDMSLNINWGLPLADGSARFIYCAHVLEHLRFVDQAPPFIAEIYRLLETGGIVRLVVPDLRKLFEAYARRDHAFFAHRQDFYPLDEGFMEGGIANLSYLLLFSGAASQLLNFNHKFGYDAYTLTSLLEDAGFRHIRECSFQASPHEELKVDDAGENAHAKNMENVSFSLFVEAVK